MNVGSLFLSLGIKGDTKSLEDAIKKVEELKKQTQELNKALKETKANSKLDVSTTSSTKTKTPKESQILREEAAVGAAKLKIAKTELGFINLEEKAKNKQEREQKKREREQKKREKDREKATKDFFNQVENGFSFIAKTFTGGLLAGGVAGYVASQASKQVSLAASLRQYGISPEKSQRYANVFREASYGQIGTQETDAFIANLADRIARSKFDPSELLPFNMIGADPSKIKDFDSAIKEIRSYSKNPNYKTEDITALLGKLGLSKEFTPAFTKEFSDEKFKNAYDSAKILSDAEVDAAAKLNLAFSQLGNSFDVLQGKMLKEFAPALEGIIKLIDGKLNPESVGKATEYAGIALGGLALLGGGKFVAKNPYAAAAIGTYASTEYLTGGRSVEGGKKLWNNPLSSFKEGFNILSRKKKFGDISEGNPYKTYEDYRDQMFKDYGTPLKESDQLITRDQAYKDVMEAIDSSTHNSANNVNTTVNINAGSVDKNTAPYIANEINSNVNKSLYNSKYPTLSVPK